MRAKQIIVHTITAVFLLLFLYSGFSKFFAFEDFRGQLKDSPFLSPFSSFFSWAIPFTEISIAVMLVLKRIQLAGLYCSFTLMIIFTIYLILIVQTNDYLPCGCGGFIEQLPKRPHVILNIVLTSISGVGLYLKKQTDKTKQITSQDTSYA